MNKLIFGIGLTVFLGLLMFSLFREMERNEQEIQVGITGVIHLAPGIGSELVKTDNAYILLYAPDAPHSVAMHVMTPFLPPVTFHIGQQHALKNHTLQGSYRLLVVVDKDGSPERPSPGEVIGPLTDPIPLGTERYDYVLNQPFLEMPQELRLDSP